MSNLFTQLFDLAGDKAASKDANDKLQGDEAGSDLDRACQTDRYGYSQEDRCKSPSWPRAITYCKPYHQCPQ